MNAEMLVMDDHPKMLVPTQQGNYEVHYPEVKHREKIIKLFTDT